MIEIALGVCLGILAAVAILNWWQAHLVRRAERRERKALRRAERQAAQDHAEWLRAYEDSLPPPPRVVLPLPQGPGVVFVTFWVLSITVALLAIPFLLPH